MSKLQMYAQAQARARDHLSPLMSVATIDKSFASGIAAMSAATIDKSLPSGNAARSAATILGPLNIRSLDIFLEYASPCLMGLFTPKS
jgi:hypothetical protein